MAPLRRNRHHPRRFAHCDPHVEPFYDYDPPQCDAYSSEPEVNGARRRCRYCGPGPNGARSNGSFHDGPRRVPNRRASFHEHDPRHDEHYGYPTTSGWPPSAAPPEPACAWSGSAYAGADHQRREWDRPARGEISDLRQRLEDAQVEIEQAQIAAHENHRQSQLKDRKIQAVGTRLERLNKDTDGYIGRIDTLQADLRKEQEARVSESSTHNHRIQELERQNDQLKTKCDRLEKAYQEHQAAWTETRDGCVTESGKAWKQRHQKSQEDFNRQEVVWSDRIKELEAEIAKHIAKEKKEKRKKREDEKQRSRETVCCIVM